MFQELLSMPVVASEHGQDVDNFIIYIHWLMLALFIGWTSYYLYALFRFRESKKQES
jgi:heme/copper-type cytochrome/quinol oxidase subunit 2